MNYTLFLNWVSDELFRSQNMVQTVQRTILRFLTNLLMRCKHQPELRCADCTQTCLHMLTHDTCSLSSIRGRNPWLWMPRLCHALTYLLVFICRVPQITLTLQQVHNEAISSEASGWKHSRRQPCVAVPVFTSSLEELSGFDQSDARFVELNEQFPEHVEQSVLDPEHSFVTVRQTAQSRFAK